MQLWQSRWKAYCEIHSTHPACCHFDDIMYVQLWRPLTMPQPQPCLPHHLSGSGCVGSSSLLGLGKGTQIRKVSRKEEQQADGPGRCEWQKRMYDGQADVWALSATGCNHPQASCCCHTRVPSRVACRCCTVPDAAMWCAIRTASAGSAGRTLSRQAATLQHSTLKHCGPRLAAKTLGLALQASCRHFGIGWHETLSGP